jgi:transposase-like protein
MECSKCKSSRHIKNGHIHGLQRYKCKDCGRSFTVEFKSTSKSESVKRQALMMYLEGLGFSSIGGILRVSHVSVLHWIRKYGREIDTIRNDQPVEVMELDELHTYIGHKKL